MAGFQEGIEVTRVNDQVARLLIRKKVGFSSYFPEAGNFDAIAEVFSDQIRGQLSRLFNQEIGDRAPESSKPSEGKTPISNLKTDIELRYRKVINLGTSSEGNLHDGRELLQVQGQVAGSYEAVKAGGKLPIDREGIIAEMRAGVLELIGGEAETQFRWDIGQYLQQHSSAK